MNRYKYLLKNIGLLIISSFGTKILSFILIPLYTSVLSTAEYGTYDYYSTTVSLMIPVLTLNIIESVMRFSLDKQNNPKDVFSIGLKKIIIASIVFSVFVLLNYILCVIPIFVDYAFFLIVLFVSTLFYDFLSQFARGIAQIKDVAIAGAINSIAFISLNIIFLLYIKSGLSGYFIANCMALIIPTLYYLCRLKIWNYCSWKSVPKLKDEMFSYSKPLVFNTVAWWINNVSDRYIVTWLCGMAANGVYSVAYKIPSVLNIFQSIFGQAWTISAVKEFDEHSGSFYSRIYNAYNCGMVIVCSALIVFDKLMAKILFAKEFYMAWKYAPFLMISVVFGALSGLLGGIFSAAKKSKVIATTTLVGASVNTVLNICLVYLWGPVGAAISTVVSYCLVWIARYKEANKIVKLTINIWRDAFTYLLLIAQAIVLLMNNGSALYACEILIFILVICLYLTDIKGMTNDVLRKIKKRDY